MIDLDWNCCSDKISDYRNDNNGPNKYIIESKSFKHKTSIISNVSERITSKVGNEIPNRDFDPTKTGTKQIEMAVPFKH